MSSLPCCQTATIMSRRGWFGSQSHGLHRNWNPENMDFDAHTESGILHVYKQIPYSFTMQLWEFAVRSVPSSRSAHAFATRRNKGGKKLRSIWIVFIKAMKLRPHWFRIRKSWKCMGLMNSFCLGSSLLGTVSMQVTSLVCLLVRESLEL